MSARWLALALLAARADGWSLTAHRAGVRRAGGAIPPRMAEVTPGEGFQVEQDASLLDPRGFERLKYWSIGNTFSSAIGLAWNSALRSTRGGGHARAEAAILWWILSRVACVLIEASRNGRLRAPTFKLLNAGVVAALALDTLQVARFARGELSGVLWSHAFLAVPSVRALRRYGLPRVVPPSGAPQTRSGLALSYALLGTCSASAFVASTCGRLPVPVSSLNLVPTAALLALRGAAAAGPKRLASPTYLQLNRALRNFALAGALVDLAALGRGTLVLPALWMRARVLLACALTLACTEGYRRGASFTESGRPGADGTSAPVIDVRVIE